MFLWATEEPIRRRCFPKQIRWGSPASRNGPHLIKAHRHLEITEEERQRFVALYMEALDEAGLPYDESFRQAVRSHIEFGSRVARRTHTPRPTPTFILCAMFHAGWPGEGDN